MGGSTQERMSLGGHAHGFCGTGRTLTSLRPGTPTKRTTTACRWRPTGPSQHIPRHGPQIRALGWHGARCVAWPRATEPHPSTTNGCDAPIVQRRTIPRQVPPETTRTPAVDRWVQAGVLAYQCLPTARVPIAGCGQPSAIPASVNRRATDLTRSTHYRFGMCARPLTRIFVFSGEYG